ncbi:hypothetical protein SLS56_009218, partial [Neofusicoccum ribis]
SNTRHRQALEQLESLKQDYNKMESNLQAEVAHLTTELRQTREQNGHLVKQNNQLNDLNAQINEEKEALVQAADNLHLSMAKMEVMFAEQPPDDIVLGRINTVINRIKTWSVEFSSTGPTSPAALLDDDLVNYHVIFPETTDLDYLHQQFLEKKRRRLFVRGWTAYCIFSMISLAPHDGVFEDRNPSDCKIEEPYVEKIMEAERAMKLCKIAPGKVNDWRALSFHLFSMTQRTGDRSDQANKGLEHVYSRIIAVIKPWAKSELDFNKVETGLIAIIEEALKLLHLLRNQRARWTIRYPEAETDRESGSENHFLFDSSCMVDSDDENTPQEGKVEVVITPAVFKRGDANGEHFDIESCLQKSAVVMSQ